MTRVIISPEGRDDLHRIISHLASVAGRATADRWNRKLWTAIDCIAEYPGSGAPRPALGANTRITIVTPYVVIYEHIRGSETLHVLRVLHGRQDITMNVLSRRQK